MFFASDNTSGILPEVMHSLQKANARGYDKSYGADVLMHEVTAQLRTLFEAPEAVVHLVSTGTAANALALACMVQPWQTIYCHKTAHIAESECGAPEFYSGGAKLTLLDGEGGKIAPKAFKEALETADPHDVHEVQRGALSMTNITECGTLYSDAELRALTALAKAYNVPCHLDGARFANALQSSGKSAAEMSWKSGIDALSFGGTKNGCMGVEAVLLFDPAKAWELELRRKRAGHLLSKNRFLAAQLLGYLEDDAWQRSAAQANLMARRLADGLARRPEVGLLYDVDANMLFTRWPKGTHARLAAAGAEYHAMRPLADGQETARLVTSWSTRPEDVEQFLAAL